MSNRMFKTILIAGAVLMLAAPVHALERDGFRVGMTFDEAQKTVPLGYSLKLLPNATSIFQAYIPINDRQDVFGSLAFCRGHLISYASPNINVDGEYINEVERAISIYGSQPRTKVISSSWSGRGGGTIQTMSLTWTLVSGEQYEIDLLPQGHDSYGNVSHIASAFVRIAAQNTRCS
jgi:hypothetical protein